MTTFILSLKKWSLFCLLIVLFFIFFYFDLHHFLSIHTIKNYQSFAIEWTDKHYFIGIILYMVLFTVLIACGIPCATFFSVFGGFLFGIIGLLYALFGTTLGGVVLFYATRNAIGTDIAKHSRGWIKRLEKGFQQNAFYYLLTLRLIPILPCWVSNISAGALNVPIFIFICATILGITPATFIYVMAGRSLDTFIASEKLDLNLIKEPTILLPLIGLVFLTIVPLFYRLYKYYWQKNLTNES